MVSELDQYNFAQLRTKPAPKSWSLGQVYCHLLEATAFFVEQVKTCLSTTANINEAAAPAAKIMFQNNSFPDEILEGPPFNKYTPQPAS
ncbi:hypothetical protein AHMF7605_10245 [Adhaeribacter arboris]|uniref:DinB-like domain-containing protein n=1 Tax=Adhaeribacter arboris TaxID=2072846 RepID=A0A2T2YEI8_9BACT|nr:hypothetical protein [Adhaeribacter arboris]PSR53868.1 hypothetical protein AHMF7605_10245 [Adhaeribacter arboris]